MIIKNIEGITVLEAEGEMTLTNGEATGSPVWLGVGDVIENWSEIFYQIEEVPKENL